MNSPLHSLRWRLQLWHSLILLATIGGVCVAVYRLAWNNELRRIDKELGQRERALVFALAQAAGGSGTSAKSPRPLSPEEILEHLSASGVTLPAETTAFFQGHEPGFAYFSFRDRADRILLQSPNAPADLALLRPPEQGLVEEIRSVDRRRESYRSSDQGLRGLIGRDITPEQDEMRRFAWSLAAAGGAVWALGLLGGWWLAGRAIRPIETISRTASRIAEGNLQERIENVGTASELDQLSGVLNRTFDRLRETFQRQRQFTADAAHELRTPITILTAETQRILKRDRSAEEYRDAFVTCAQTVARMRRLVEDLLLLARQEADTAPHEPCDLAAILREAVEHLTTLATAKNIVIHTDLQPAECVAHPPGITTVANNLLANAIQHHPGGGHVHISTQRENGHATFTIRDDGPGIAAADLPHIFDRFYRADKARTADASLHTGLGLAIVKTILDAHAGIIECQSTFGEGATFVVHLPESARGFKAPDRHKPTPAASAVLLDQPPAVHTIYPCDRRAPSAAPE